MKVTASSFVLQRVLHKATLRQYNLRLYLSFPHSLGDSAEDLVDSSQNTVLNEKTCVKTLGPLSS